MKAMLYDQLDLRYWMPGRLNGQANWVAPEEYEDRWILTKELRFSVQDDEDGTFRMYTVPAGTTTDLASVPKELWDEIPPYGLHLAASVVHDWLYENRINTREWADKVFVALMKNDHVPSRRVWIMNKAVRVFGQGAWDD